MHCEEGVSRGKPTRRLTRGCAHGRLQHWQEFMLSIFSSNTHFISNPMQKSTSFFWSLTKQHSWHAKFSVPIQTSYVSEQHCTTFLATFSIVNILTSPVRFKASSVSLYYPPIMYTSTLSFLSTLLLASLTDATTILDRQCWHGYPLSTMSLSSSPDMIHEFISPLSFPFQSPWSYPPTCTPHLPSINSKLCIYTSTSFSSNRGISIFTTPSLAAQFALLPAFTSPSTLIVQNINIPTNTYRTATLPSKGIGMLASRPLKFGDVVTAHTPAFLAYLESDLSTADREIWWRRAIAQLPIHTQQDFLSLATVYGDERVRVQDIVKANTFQVEVGGGNHLAVFPETSRVNHGCAPKYVFLPSEQWSWG
jgi:hypothetical protein